MNLRSTTPFLDFFQLARVVIGAAFVVFVITATGATTRADDADSRQKKIDQLSKEIDAADTTAESLGEQSATLQSTLESIDNEQAAVARAMQSTENNQQASKESIKAAEKQLQAQRDVLGEVMADYYVEHSISPLEMLASSGTIGDYLDRQEYKNAMRDQIIGAIESVKKAKLALQKNQNDLAALRGQQENQKIALEKKQQEKNDLLKKTLGEEAAFEQLSAEKAAEKRQLQEQQQAAIAATMGGAELVASVPVDEPAAQPTPPPSAPETTPGSTQTSPTPSTPSPAQPKPTPPKTSAVNGGYPANLNNCYVDANALSYGFDPWGYGCRQCVSYTAFKMVQKSGRAPMYWGNARDWPASARRAGYATGTTPRAGSVAVVSTGPYGHVAWVESVNRNGTINISQYNYWVGTGWGKYSAFKNVSPRAYQTYIYV